MRIRLSIIALTSALLTCFAAAVPCPAAGQDRVEKLLEELTNAPGISGQEAAVRKIVLRGAHTSSQVVKPDLGISVEVGVAGDYPGAGPDQAQEKLGGGPGLFLHDSSMLPNLKLRDLFFRVASDKGIPLQSELVTGYGEDGAEMQRWFAGTPTVNFTVPVRYLHSFHGVIRREDFDQAVELLVEVLMRLDAKTVAELKSFDSASDKRLD